MNFAHKFPIYLIVQFPLEIDEDTLMPLIDGKSQFVRDESDHDAILAFSDVDKCDDFIAANNYKGKAGALRAGPDEFAGIARATALDGQSWLPVSKAH